MKDLPITMDEPAGWIEKTGGYAKDMTLRDYFAAKAMPWVYADYCESANTIGFEKGWRDGVAIDAYAMADAMLKAREA